MKSDAPGISPLEALPPASFVPFNATRLGDSWVVYEGVEFFGTHRWCEDFGYVITSEADGTDGVNRDSKVFLAERYGGGGLLGHGGGVRVGLSGHYQIKGIGTNPLCDAGTPSGEWAFWHSHGGMALSDAIREAVWGEVLSVALPYGGVRVAAILGTDARCWYKSSQGEVKETVRGLAVREAVIRPAHFLRAVTFRPSATFVGVSDPVRVAAAIERLPWLLPRGRQMDASGVRASEAESLNIGLREFAKRCGEQCAAARSKRLMHGALAASNLAIDGRWLDYGTTSALPHYANTHNFGLPSIAPTFWEDHLLCLRAIKDLCFYVKKYLRRIDPTMVDTRDIIEGFIDAYEGGLQTWFLRLTGIPEELYSQLGGSWELRRLSDCLIEVARYGVFRRFRPCTADLGSYASNVLGLCLIDLALSGGSEDCFNRVSVHIKSRALTERLSIAYGRVFVAACEEAGGHGVCEQALRRVASLNAARAAAPATALMQPVLWERCEMIVNEYSEEREELSAKVVELVDGLKSFAQRVLAPKPTSRCQVCTGAYGTVTFDAKDNAWRVESGGRLTRERWTAQDEHLLADAGVGAFYEFEKQYEQRLRGRSANG
jgi:hypothetical protein